MKQITENIKSLVKQWRQRIAGESDESSQHPSRKITDLLEQAYHHPEFPRDLDVRCRELMDEISSAIPKWPSITGHSHELAVIQHVENFVARLSRTESKQELNPDSYVPALLLSQHYNVNKDALRKQLERLRRRNLDCCIEDPNPQTRKSKFLYRVRDALPIIEKMQK